MIKAASFVYLTNQTRKTPKDYKVFAIFLRNIKKVLVTKIVINSREKLSEKYYEFLNVFAKQKADKLSPHRLYDHKI